MKNTDRLIFLMEENAHLEKQFTDGMTWKNHGKWHIDHRRPRDSFNLNNEDEIYMCQHA